MSSCSPFSPENVRRSRRSAAPRCRSTCSQRGSEEGGAVVAVSSPPPAVCGGHRRSRARGAPRLARADPPARTCPRYGLVLFARSCPERCSCTNAHFWTPHKQARKRSATSRDSSACSLPVQQLDTLSRTATTVNSIRPAISTTPRRPLACPTPRWCGTLLASHSPAGPLLGEPLGVAGEVSLQVLPSRPGGSRGRGGRTPTSDRSRRSPRSPSRSAPRAGRWRSSATRKTRSSGSGWSHSWPSPARSRGRSAVRFAGL
jgi:hypothetical protein